MENKTTRKNIKSALLITGGAWHDFDGFASHTAAILGAAGWVVDAANSPDSLTQLTHTHWDLVISYTCLVSDPDPTYPDALSQFTFPQIQGLADWVRQGGGFLAVHSATVLGRSDPLLGELIGGRFIKHPPAFNFTVYPVHQPHPITAGINAFEVHDELYLQHCNPEVAIHMVAITGDTAHPMVWSKTEGQGRAAYIALGHDASVWRLAPFQQLIRQAAAWLVGS